MTLDLTDDETHARYPFSPTLAPLKAILAKLGPPEPRPEPLPPSTVGLTKAFGDRDMFGSLEQPSLDRAVTAAEGYGFLRCQILDARPGSHLHTVYMTVIRQQPERREKEPMPRKIS